MNLHCLNCKAEVEQDKGKFFAEVFVCAGCHAMAEHFHNRLLKDLQYLLTIAKESIRISLVQGKFSFPESPAGEPSKKQVLEEILRMEESRDAVVKEQACPTPSSVNMPPHVRTLAALGDGSSPKASPRD